MYFENCYSKFCEIADCNVTKSNSKNGIVKVIIKFWN